MRLGGPQLSDPSDSRLATLWSCRWLRRWRRSGGCRWGGSGRGGCIAGGQHACARVGRRGCNRRRRQRYRTWCRRRDPGSGRGGHCRGNRRSLHGRRGGRRLPSSLLFQQFTSQSSVTAHAAVRVKNGQCEGQNKENPSQPRGELYEHICGLRAKNVFGYRATESGSESFAFRPLHQDYQHHQQRDEQPDREKQIDQDVHRSGQYDQTARRSKLSSEKNEGFDDPVMDRVSIMNSLPLTLRFDVIPNCV
jgi:hypothetical protein